MSVHRGLLLLVPFCLVLFLFDLDGTDLVSAHEARAAQNAQRMIDDNSWGLPRLYDGQADLQKPPAFYWMVAALACLNDGVVTRWSVRLPAAIAGFLTVLLVYACLARRDRPRAGFIAAVVLASSVHFTASARTGRIDMPLTCAITAAVMLLTSSRSSARHIVLAGLCMAAALLLKGPVGVALTLSVTGVVLFANCLGPSPAKRPWRSVAGASAVALAVATPWFVWADRQTGGEFFRVFFWHHNVERATGDSASLAVHPWWYYGPRFAADFLPWTPVLLIAFVIATRSSLRDDEPARIGLLWLAVTIGVLSLARFKRADYLLPAYPGAALFLGCVLDRWYQRAAPAIRMRDTAAFLASLPLCLAGWWAFHVYYQPRFEAAREQEPFARHIRELAPAPATVMLFRVESHLLAYHLGRPVHTLVEWGELNERLAAPGTHYFVTRAEFVPECLAHVRTRPLEVVARNEDFCRAAPLRPLVLLRTADATNGPACPSTSTKD